MSRNDTAEKDVNGPPAKLAGRPAAAIIRTTAGRPSLPEVSPMCSRLRPFVAGLALLAVALVATRDGAVVTAQPKAAPVAASPQAPTLNVAFPLGAQRGQTIELTLTGTNLADPTALWTSFGGKAT